MVKKKIRKDWLMEAPLRNDYNPERPRTGIDGRGKKFLKMLQDETKWLPAHPVAKPHNGNYRLSIEFPLRPKCRYVCQVFLLQAHHEVCGIDRSNQSVAYA